MPRNNSKNRRSGSMTVEEAGRLGGQQRARDEDKGIGPSYEEIGQKGGQSRSSNRGGNRGNSQDK